VTVVTAGLTIRRTENREALAKRTAAAERGKLEEHSSGAGNQDGEARDSTQMRVDKLASVPPSQLYQVLMRSSPEEIAALGLKFNDLPKNGKTIGATAIFFQAWAELDGKSALQGAFQIRDTGLRKMALSTVVHSASPGLAPELAAYLVEHPDKDLKDAFRDDLLPQAMESWSLIDPTAAAKFFDELPLVKKSAYSTGTGIAYAWGTVDPYAALSWAERENMPEVDSGSLMNAVIAGWCDVDVNAAGAFVKEHLDRSGSQLAAYSVAATLFDQDPKKAIDWLGDLPWGEAKDEAESKLARFWAEKDPSAASRWVEELPSVERPAVAVSLASAWALSDWPAASTWIAGLNGESHNAAVQSAIQNIPAGIPPTEPLALALSITDKDQRFGAVMSVIQLWTAKDPEAAAAWVKNSSLTKEEKQLLLSKEEPSQ
jgi:hypothetical protein